MTQNIFFDDKRTLTLQDYMQNGGEGRDNLGDQVPIAIYRLFENSVREELKERFGKPEQEHIFRSAGFRAGEYFARNFLDVTLPVNEFLSLVHEKMEDLKIGVFRVEELNRETGRFIITVAEDADCSGLPVMGETVCNYSEGFLSGILTTYTGRLYKAQETDCWATGDRVCRFCAELSKQPRSSKE